VDVRDFEVLKNIYEQNVNHDLIDQDAQELGVMLRQQLGLDWPCLDAQQSKFTLDLYDETIELVRTYYKR
jgi:hypothetical protein